MILAWDIRNRPGGLRADMVQALADLNRALAHGAAGQQTGPDLAVTGLAVDARGSADLRPLRSTWDVDVLRGPRSVQATTRLDDAARPWDRLAFEAEARDGALRFSTGLRGALTRGAEVSELTHQ